MHVDTLKWSIRDSKHDVLYKTLGPLLNGLVKKQIQKALGDAIRTGFEYIDGQLVGVRERTKEVRGSEGTGKVEALKEVSFVLSSFCFISSNLCFLRVDLPEQEEGRGEREVVEGGQRPVQDCREARFDASARPRASFGLGEPPAGACGRGGEGERVAVRRRSMSCNSSPNSLPTSFSPFLL